MFGFFNLNKSPGPTSHDLVAQVRRHVPRGVKVGHAGTLDPFAEGVLVICVGPATRLASYVQVSLKRYVAEITLGATSTTDDLEGEITATAHAASPTEPQVRDALTRFIGEIEQVPPAHSAVHVEGRRAYKLARSDKHVDLPPRRVMVHSIELLRYEGRHLEIGVVCESGTYIRALARDVGEALGVGGYCSRLKRTEVGPFRIEDAIRIEELEPSRDLIQPLFALQDIPKCTLEPAQARRIANGNTVELSGKFGPGEIAALGESGDLLAIAVVKKDGKTLQPTKVLASE